MTLEAPFAMAAGAVGVDGDQSAALEPEFGKIFTEIAAELVARHEAVADLRRSDAAVLVIVQIAAADPNRGDIDQRLARSSLAQGVRPDPDIPDPVQKDGLAHGGSWSRPAFSIDTRRLGRLAGRVKALGLRTRLKTSRASGCGTVAAAGGSLEVSDLQNDFAGLRPFVLLAFR